LWDESSTNVAAEAVGRMIVQFEETGKRRLEKGRPRKSIFLGLSVT
jgi:hypothetical protein